LSTGLAVLKAGFVLVANCPTNNTPPVPGALPGSLLLIDKNGNLAAPPLVSSFIQGPWDFTVQDDGANVKIFISNADNVHLHGALAMVLAPNGHLLVSNSDGINPDPNQPSEIVEFTVQGQFIGQLSVDPAQGGSFGLNIVKVSDDVFRFAAVDDNANTITIWKLNTANLTDPQRNKPGNRDASLSLRAPIR
jgi:hypothetical protein